MDRKKILLIILILSSGCFSIQIINKENVKIKKNNFLKNENVIIFNSNNIYIDASKFIKNDCSIFINSSSNIYIYNTSFLNNNFSIYIEKSNNIYIIDNKFYKSKKINLLIKNSNNIVILNNKFYNNIRAIYIFNSTYLKIKKNIFSNNFEDSISIHSSENIEIKTNVINKSKKYKYSSNGVNIINSNNIKIFFNTIQNNYDNGINIEQKGKNIIILGNIISNNGKNINSGVGIYINGNIHYNYILFNIFSKNEAQNILIQEPIGWKSYDYLPEKIYIMFNIFLPNKKNNVNEKTFHITIGSYGNYKNVNFRLNYIILFNQMIGKYNYGSIEGYNIFLSNALIYFNIFINCYKDISFLQPKVYPIDNLTNYLNIFGNIKIEKNSIYFINKYKEESFLEINKTFDNISIFFDFHITNGTLYFCPLFTDIINKYEIAFDKKNNQICLNIMKKDTWKNILCKQLKLKKYEKVRIDLIKNYRNTKCIIYLNNKSINFTIDNIFKNKISFEVYNHYGTSNITLKNLKIIEYLK